MEFATEVLLKYNNNTYCIEDYNKEIILNKTCNDNNIKYDCNSSNKDKHCILFSYKNIEIKLTIKSSIEILLLYVILQFHYSVINIQELVSIDNWDYNLWKVNISSLNEEEELPDHLILLNCFLNLNNKYNKPIEISELETLIKIKDKRGIGGERPRELNYKYGFPYFTSSTKKYLNNSQRIFICPFPIENINPQRKAIINKNNNTLEIKCFTCGTKEGETNIFGQTCKFEKGHLTPIKCENTTNSYWQCKWCNTFYKDKIIWNDITNKPEFNYYAIIRDMKKTEIIKILKQLGIQSSDLF